MKKPGKKMWKIMFAMALMATFLPLCGAKRVYAETYFATLSLDVSEGVKTRVDGDELKVLFAALHILEEEEKITSNGQLYDLDKDGKYDLAVDNHTSEEEGDYSEFYAWEDNSITGIMDFDLDDTEISALLNSVRSSCDSIEFDFRKPVTEISLTLKQPLCGTETTTPKDGDSYQWQRQTNTPVSSFAKDPEWLDGIYNYWETDEECKEPYIGTFNGGDSYYADIWFYMKNVYKTGQSVKLIVNDREFTLSKGTIIAKSGKNEDIEPVRYYTEEVVEDKSQTLVIVFRIKAVHNLGDTPIKVKDPTCTEGGTCKYICAGCNESFTEQLLPKGHHWNETYTTDKAATYEEEGSESIHCSVCGAIKEGSSRKIDKLVQKTDPVSITGNKLKVKFKKLAKKDQKIKSDKAFVIKNAEGDVIYKRAAIKTKKKLAKLAKKKIKVAKNGTITLKKGLKKGSYKVKVKVTAAAKGQSTPETKEVTVTIKVK